MGSGSERIGVVGLAEGWSSRELLRAIGERGCRGEMLDPAGLELDLARGLALGGGGELGRFDALMVKKLGSAYSPSMLDRLQTLRYAWERGLPVFSSPLAMAQVISRLSCTVGLSLAGIPMPRTAICQDPAQAARAVERLGTCLAKPLFSSKARGMRRLVPGPGLEDELRGFQAQGHPVIYLQQWLDLPGRDLGVVFLGGEYLCTYARTPRRFGEGGGEPPGGKYSPCQPGPEVIALAARAQAVFRLDFTCVDVVESGEGPLVLEVSAFGGFRGIKEAHGLDAAGLYVDHVLKRLRRVPRSRAATPITGRVGPSLTRP